MNELNMEMRRLYLPQKMLSHSFETNSSRAHAKILYLWAKTLKVNFNKIL